MYFLVGLWTENRGFFGFFRPFFGDKSFHGPLNSGFSETDVDFEPLKPLFDLKNPKYAYKMTFNP